MAEEKPAFRKPGDAATLPELIKFLNDRSGVYSGRLRKRLRRRAFSRIENLKELANAAQDAQERGETLHEFLDHAALVSDADSVLGRGEGDADDAACGEGAGVSTGVSGGDGGGAVSALADVYRSDRARRRAAALLCGHDAGDGYAGDDAGAVPAAVWQRYAGGFECTFTVSGRGAAAAGGGPWEPSAKAGLEFELWDAIWFRWGGSGGTKSAGHEDGERHYSVRG